MNVWVFLTIAGKKMILLFSLVQFSKYVPCYDCQVP